MRLLRFLAAAAILITALAAAGPASAATRHPLPAPTGPFAVGIREFHLIDDRPDLWVPERNRELMVSAWYPALAPVGKQDPYATPQESALILASQKVDGLAPEALSEVATHAYVDAPQLGIPLPTVVLSPGFSMPRFSLTALAEELASRGYLVLGIDHTHEAAAITFPDGRITECLACQGRPDAAKFSANRAQDVSFVLDQLIPRLPVDRSRIAMGGHSAGGFTAPYALAEDVRIRAGFNLDGGFPALPYGRAVNLPFLMMGAPHHAPSGAYGSRWAAVYEAFNGWKRWLIVDGATHGSFTDYAPIADHLGVELPGNTLHGARAIELTRKYVSAFLDHHLSGVPTPILDAAADPEIRIA
ncbi:alpha/beta hydrolase family protein [Nocardia goodfellowii]|uniref:Dienelactone hydrolase n=1 Tax=Nocardia goodfellowii TaxID=882446 RepID=A0ABS4QS36_9NOCA|nr:alpha/beta hydrolase [Nocardia goodfellowii]MBP2193854.1 dienelactone hydrolase [Nocardia goodfellowii]